MPTTGRREGEGARGEARRKRTRSEKREESEIQFERVGRILSSVPRISRDRDSFYCESGLLPACVRASERASERASRAESWTLVKGEREKERRGRVSREKERAA